jgi:hypothetical protein
LIGARAVKGPQVNAKSTFWQLAWNSQCRESKGLNANSKRFTQLAQQPKQTLYQQFLKTMNQMLTIGCRADSDELLRHILGPEKPQRKNLSCAISNLTCLRLRRPK